MKTTLKLTASALVITALTAGSALANDHKKNHRADRTDRTYSTTRHNDMRTTDGRDANRAWYEGNSHRIYNATQDTNLSGDTARGGGTIGMANSSYNDHGRTYTGEQTSATVVKH